MIKQFYFKLLSLALVICFLSIWMLNISIWPMGRTLSGATRMDQEVMVMKRYSTVPKTPAWLEHDHFLVSYSGHSLWVGSYPSEQMQLVYSTAPANRVRPCISTDIVNIYQNHSSSSSYHAASTDIPDPHSPLFPIVHSPLGRSSGLHSVSSQSCWMYVRAGRPAFAQPYVGVHWSASLMSSSPASPAVSCVSGSSNLYIFHDERQVAV